MRRFRQAVYRLLTAAGPGLLLVGAVCAAGFALHAADGWHHHGEMGAGFFHLHFHIGDHDHPDLEHSHAGHTHQNHPDHDSAAINPIDTNTGARHSDHEVPEDDHPAPAEDSRKSHAVLTVPHAVKNLTDAAPTIEARAASPGGAVSIAVLLPRMSWRYRTADPRGPPA